MHLLSEGTVVASTSKQCHGTIFYPIPPCHWFLPKGCASTSFALQCEHLQTESLAIYRHCPLVQVSGVKQDAFLVTKDHKFSLLRFGVAELCWNLNLIGHTSQKAEMEF